MSFLSYSNINIAGLAGAVPAHIQYRDMSQDDRRSKSFFKRTGVKQRHISLTGQTNMDMAYVASKTILKKAEWDVKSLDAICSFTQSPDFFPGPGNAHLLQYRLGLRQDALVLDSTMGCSAFSYALATAASFLQNPNIKRLLIVCGDSHWYQYASAGAILSHNEFLHGEGSVAILLERKEQSPLININLHADGSGYKYLFAPFGGIRNKHKHKDTVVLPDGTTFHSTKDAVANNMVEYMDGLEVTSFATSTVVKSIQNFLEQGSLHDFDGLILHQANIQIITTIAKRLELDMDKVPVSVDRYGNTNGATIPITMVDAYADSQKDSLALITAGFGVGLSWGIASFSIAPAVIEPMILVEDDIFEEAVVK